MATSTAPVSANTGGGGNALAALLAAAAASMHQQKQPPTSNTTFMNNITDINRFNKPEKYSHGTSRNSINNSTQDPSNNNLIDALIKRAQQQATTTNINKTPSSSSGSTSGSSSNAAKLLVSLINGASPKSSSVKADDQCELRNLESWHDEDAKKLDSSHYQELVELGNSNGWSADEMFKYNEKMHKITSSYSEKTLSGKYTTPLPKTNSKTTIKLATQLAKEIQDRVIAEGRITPESSDDDELFENNRMRREQMNQQRRMVSQHRQRPSNNHSFVLHTNKTIESSSHYSNSTETPATASLSSSPTLNDTVIKPVTCSSRNILRTCLT